MTRYIKVSNEVRSELRRLTGASESAIWYALNYERHGEQSERVRALALQLGGQIHLDLPETQIVHDTDGRMVQTFGNGALLIIRKSNGHVEVQKDGEVKVEAPNPRVSELMALQQYAAQL